LSVSAFFHFSQAPMIPIRIDSAWKGTSDCRSCGIRDMVLFADLNEQDFSEMHTPIDDLSFGAGDVMYAEGQTAQGLFTLRKGTVKLIRTTVDGRERIVRVLRPGDVINHLSANSPRLHLRLMQKWQQALKDADDWLAELNFGSARQRVARLALKMREPEEPRFTAFFARDDMGSMLDLKLETVSREISGLVRDGALKACDKQGRRYEILNEKMLMN
jgi:CRP/FNR family transcriptional regulator, anaerobic regulatory protein